MQKVLHFCLQEQRKRLVRENAIAFETSLAAVEPSNAKHCVVPLGSPIQTAVMKMAAFSFIYRYLH